MAAVAYATEFGGAKTRSSSTGVAPRSYKTATDKPASKKKPTKELKRNGNPPSNEKGKRIQIERAASKTRNHQKIRKGIAFLAAVASTKPKYGGLRITGKDPFVEFRKKNNELFSKRVLQMIHHYTGINIGWSNDSIRSKNKSKSSDGPKRTDDILRAVVTGEDKYEHRRYGAVSDEEKYDEGEQARLCLFFLCELAFNEAKFITKGVTDNMISGRTITGVMNDLVTAAVSKLGKLDKSLGYDSTTKREQDLYRAISVMGREADLFTEKTYDSATDEVTNAHKLFENLTKLGFDSQFSSKRENSETESTCDLWVKEEFEKILEKLGNTKYKHTKEIIGNIGARTSETAEPSVITSITGTNTINTSLGTGRGSNTNKGQKSQKGKKGDQPQSNSAENDTSQGTRDANSNKGASVAKQKGNKAEAEENVKTMANKKGDAISSALSIDTSKTPAAENDNVALVDLSIEIYDKLTEEGIVNPDRTYHAHGLSYLRDDDNTNTLIVEPDAASADIESVIQKYVAWQDKKTTDRIVIFLDRGSELRKHIYRVYNDPSKYRLFWAKLDFGYLYCVKAKTDEDFDTSALSKFINERLSSKTDNLIKWNLNEEDPDYKEQERVEDDQTSKEDEYADDSGSDSDPEEEKKEKKEKKRKMRGIAVSCPCDESSYVAVSFSVGLDEPLDAVASKPRGRAHRVSASTIAHLAEHVVATLTCASSPEQETALGIVRSTGISQNASTSAYETCFFASGATDDLERTWIPMLGAAIGSPNLGARCVETERSAALDEMYGVRASCAVTDGKLDTYIASVEAPGSWQTRVDDDIAYLESESTERVADAIGAFIAEYYCPARMHVTVASADADRLLSAVRRFVLPSTRRPGALGRAAVLPRSVYKWTSWDPGSVSVIAGSAGDTTRVRFCASVNVSRAPRGACRRRSSSSSASARTRSTPSTLSSTCAP